MKPHTLTLCLLLTAAAVYLCCGIGFGAWESPLAMDEIVRQIRLPRIYTALLVGAGLSASGAALQALFENPLADPSLIGTSGGAALGVIVLLDLGGGAMGVPAAAFLGALGVCLLILAVHKLLAHRNTQAQAGRERGIVEAGCRIVGIGVEIGLVGFGGQPVFFITQGRGQDDAVAES